MSVENLTKDFYGRNLFRAFVRADDGAIRHDYAEVEVLGHKYRLYASRDEEDVSNVEEARVFARFYGKHTGRIYDSDEAVSHSVKFLVEEDGKVVAQLELFNNEYILLLDGKELGREVAMLLDAGWQAEF
jgi:hypothetical protein